MNILVVAAHPDDEVLGASGTMARHAAAGDRVSVLICTTGLTSRGPVEAEEIEALRNSAERAADVLGASPPTFLAFPDNAMDTVPLLEVIRAVSEAVDTADAEMIYTHHPGDLNIDHGIVARAVLTACRPLPGHRLQAIYGFETMSSTEWAPASLATPFTPSHFVDITDQLETKLAALQCYQSEMRPFPHARSHEALASLARLRGAMAGFPAAEAFVPLRSFWPAS